MPLAADVVGTTGAARIILPGYCGMGYSLTCDGFVADRVSDGGACATGHNDRLIFHQVEAGCFVNRDQRRVGGDRDSRNNREVCTSASSGVVN